MASRKSRLPHEEFSTRGYREVATPYFLMRARKNSLRENRIGVIIGVSSVKSATRRNFWRRQVKSVLAEVLQKGFDFLIIIRRPAALSRKSIFRKALNEAASSLISNL